MHNTQTKPILKLLTLSHFDGLELPAYETTGAAGLDLRAAIDENNPIILHPSQRVLVPTGLVFELPEHYEAQIRPRSGLALNHGITCLNTPGTIDSDYRGEIQVLLINLGQEDFHITRGMRIAQTVIAPVTQVQIKPIDALSQTKRGTGGFGSTGKV